MKHYDILSKTGAWKRLFWASLVILLCWGLYIIKTECTVSVMLGVWCLWTLLCFYIWKFFLYL